MDITNLRGSYKEFKRWKIVICATVGLCLAHYTKSLRTSNLCHVSFCEAQSMHPGCGTVYRIKNRFVFNKHITRRIMKTDGNLQIKNDLRNTQSLLMDEKFRTWYTNSEKQLWAVIPKKARIGSHCTSLRSDINHLCLTSFIHWSPRQATPLPW